MKIDYSTSANCSPEQVWAVFSDVSTWSQWNPMARASWVEGEPWQTGSQILLEPTQAPTKIKAKVVDSALPHSVSWQGSAMGVTFVHRFDFTSQPDGTTLMKTVVDLSGAATFFISNKMKQQGIDMFAQWFNALKTEAEKRTVAGSVDPR